MKKLVVMVIALGLVFGASAQYKRTGPRNVRPGKTVIVRTYPSISPFYGYGRGYYGYSPLYGYSPFGYGFNNGYMPQNKPTKLDLEVEDIKNEYQDRIKSVRLADDLSRKEKRQKVQELKSMRDKLITETKKNYYKSDSRV
jgi:hypothetical protein